MNIRFADKADFDAILGLVNRAFEVESSFINGDRLDRRSLRGYFDKGRGWGKTLFQQLKADALPPL
jgi:hypothetical protein